MNVPLIGSLAAPTADPAEALKKLAELHSAGIVTDDEFALLRAFICVAGGS